jgi:hypothetical protein
MGGRRVDRGCFKVRQPEFRSGPEPWFRVGLTPPADGSSHTDTGESFSDRYTSPPPRYWTVLRRPQSELALIHLRPPLEYPPKEPCGL